MSALKSRIARLEKGIHKRKTNSVTIEVVNLLDKHWRKNEAAVKCKYLETHENLSDLWIVRTKIPQPLPPPSPEALALVHGNSDCDGNGSIQNFE